MGTAASSKHAGVNETSRQSIYGTVKKVGAKVCRPLIVLAVLAVTTAGLWVLFRFVVTDEGTFLEYLKVLVWPLVVAGVVVWFRSPLREKVSQVLRMEGFGARVEFTPDAQARRLTHELGPELDALFQAADEGDPAEQSTGEEGPERAADEGDPAEQSRQDSASSEVPEEDAGSGDDSHHATGLSVTEALLLAQAMGIPEETLTSIQRGLGPRPKRRDRAVAYLYNEALSLRRARNSAQHKAHGSQDAVEAVIRKSAAWGYEMGKAGAPETIPDIEWNQDGTWRITTEVPSPTDLARRERAEGLRRSRHLQEAKSDRARHIQSLEDEIMKYERAEHSNGRAGLRRLGLEDPWISELRARLARLDPNNPWSNTPDRL